MFKKKTNWRYALGELLIVIIGILIAFGLNNWAQGQKDKRLAATCLENIVGDLEADISQIDSNLTNLHRTVEEINGFIPHLFSKIPGRDTLPGRMLYVIHQYVDFFPHEATFESLIHNSTHLASLPGRGTAS
ncbi:MAG TPA: hypothetical protein ENJ20_03230 [Bacteroidetes bacterium]|nr:hypothetical protein [Bacteroidota bacterium]